MKKIPVLCILIALLVVTAALSCVAFADTAFIPASADAVSDTVSTASASGVSIRLINPVAVASVGSCLFVADNVDDGLSVIHGIDISGNSLNETERAYYMELSKPIVNLAEVDGKLYIIYADSVAVYSVETELTYQTAYSDAAYQNVSDFTYDTSLLETAAEFFSSDKIYYKTSEGNVDMPENTVGAKSLLASSDATGSYVYFTKNANGLNKLQRLEIYLLGGGLQYRFNSSDKLNSLNKDFGSDFGDDFSLTGMFGYSVTDGSASGIALFGKNSVRKLDTGDFSLDTTLITSEEKIVDGSFGSDKIALLTAENKINVYFYNSDSEKFELQYTLGTDTIAQSVPEISSFTAFTLASSSGYPTNIAYKTSDASGSISECLLKENFPDSFIILDYDGAENSEFYYVLIGDKFAWIEKSDGAQSAQTDENLKIINNSVSGDVTYNAKFISMSTVAVYELPLSGSNYTTVKQSATDPQSVTVLQKFTETKSDGTTIEWYYVEYSADSASSDLQRGFVRTSNVGKFSVSSGDEVGLPVISNKKINASLFEAVKLYATSEMQSSETLYNEAGEIKLYSGTWVEVLKEEGNVSFVKIIQNNNYPDTYGWVYNDYLIGMHGMTTNAVVGISILSAAIVLSIVFVSVFVKRRKRKRTRPEPKMAEK